MNEINQRRMQAHQIKRMATKSWQHILLIGACSLALSASSVLASVYVNTSPAVSYAQAGSALAQAPFASAINNDAREQFHKQQSPVYQQQAQLVQHQSQARNVANNFNPIASSTTNTGLMPGQPSVYHSVIDRTDALSRRASPAVQTSVATTAGDLHTAAGHHHGHAHGKYYEYRAVPKKKTWKFGYKRGNHKHTIMRHEHGKAGKHPHFKTKVKWHDKKSKGKGIHLWDYNHHDKKHYHHG